ncbi:CDP-glucose 4 [Elusimicrobium posterum]|uniref:CDP-glucose 4,6-dehydratase n=1 Tax=Elusimicrobium posterum TaxID=3116653 RepID=UPI003C728AEF
MEKVVNMFNNFNNIYKGKKVLLTGHTGFKGAWLAMWLHSLGAEVTGYALEPNTEPSLFEVLNVSTKINSVFGDILDTQKLEKVFNDFKPEIVFHLAAQPLVRLSYTEPLLTYQTNVIGSLNVMQAARKCGSVKAFVNVTTDKCYENKEVEHGYKETDPMGGYDMYSSSKGCVELLTSSYRRSFLKDSYAMASARAGNVIGGGDWALDRLVPDCIRAITKGEKIEIRNPVATRPWQHVLEPLSGYLLLGELLYTRGTEFAEGFNLGPEESSVRTVADIAKSVVTEYGQGEIVVHKRDDLHEANLLMLNIDKAKQKLGWYPALDVEETVHMTVGWYKRFYNGEDMQSFTLTQIKNYEEKIKWKKN